MTEKEKADQLNNYAVKLHGIDNAKKEELSSAQSVYTLAPSVDGRMMARSYWIRVIEHLKKK